MGFWDWLTGKRNPVSVTDAIWLTHAARLHAVVAQLRGGGSAVMLAHFPVSLDEWRQELTAVGLTHTLAGSRFEARDAVRWLEQRPGPGVLLGLVRQLVADPPSAEVASSGAPLSLIVVERHFLRAEDDAVASFARGFGRPCEVTYHSSLDDPLMKVFAGDWVRDMLRNLGMNENDRIESAMVSRRIAAAQEKIATQVGEAAGEADSAEEWLRQNLPNGI